VGSAERGLHLLESKRVLLIVEVRKKRGEPSRRLGKKKYGRKKFAQFVRPL